MSLLAAWASNTVRVFKGEGEWHGWRFHFPTSRNRQRQLERVIMFLREKHDGRPLHILEIGALFGDTTKLLARHGAVTSVDPWPCGMDKFLKNTKGLNVLPYIGKSEDVLPKLRIGMYDLAYIDGDHSFRGVCIDIRHARRLVKRHGIICGDDAEQPEVHRALAAMFPDGVTEREGFWWKENT